MGDTTLSYAVGNKGAEFSLAGLPSPHRELLLNWGTAAPEAALPSPSSLRDATSPKVRGLGSPPSLWFSTLRPAAARGAVRRYAETFRLCQGLPLWGSWREAPERARMLAARLRPGLAGAYDGADFRKAQSKLTRCVLVSGLALSVIASRCHLSQSERPWQSAKLPGLYFTPCCRKGSRRRYAETFRLCQGLPLWGSWREAPERARTLATRLRSGLDDASYRTPILHKISKKACK